MITFCFSEKLVEKNSLKTCTTASCERRQNDTEYVSIEGMHEEMQSFGICSEFSGNKQNGIEHVSIEEYDRDEDLDRVDEVPGTLVATDISIIRTDLLPTGKLGSGTFADVYLVTWKEKNYAFKVYKKQGNSFSTALQEAKLTNSLQHKNIIQIYGICEEPIALLLELCEGKQLRHLWKNKSDSFNIPLRIILRWVTQIADALWYMHNRKISICHGDIKPQNCVILQIPCDCDNYVNEDSDICSTCHKHRLARLTIKLTDFGLTKMEQNKLSENGLLSTSVDPFGSIPYMSPEVIKNHIITPKSDVWSFGVLFWEILMKRIPYYELQLEKESDSEFSTRCTPGILMYGIGKGEIHLEMLKTWPLELQGVLQACLKYVENDRPSMEEVIKEIEKIPITHFGYVMVGPSMKDINRNNIEKIKNILTSSSNIYALENASKCDTDTRASSELPPPWQKYLKPAKLLNQNIMPEKRQETNNKQIVIENIGYYKFNDSSVLGRSTSSSTLHAETKTSKYPHYFILQHKKPALKPTDENNEALSKFLKNTNGVRASESHATASSSMNPSTSSLSSLKLEYLTLKDSR